MNPEWWAKMKRQGKGNLSAIFFFFSLEINNRVKVYKEWRGKYIYFWREEKVNFESWISWKLDSEFLWRNKKSYKKSRKEDKKSERHGICIKIILEHSLSSNLKFLQGVSLRYFHSIFHTCLFHSPFHSISICRNTFTGLERNFILCFPVFLSFFFVTVPTSWRR